MPIYEYACKQCKAHEEIIQKFGEETPDVCPNCNAKGTLSKVVTSSAFHLKGGGWYKDLYSSTKPDSATSKDTKSKSSSEVKEPKKDEKADKPKKDD